MEKNYENVKDLIGDIDTELFEVVLHNVKLFVGIVDLLIKHKIWNSERVINSYTSIIYGNNYNPRDFTYAERPNYMESLEELKTLTKDKSLKSELQATIDECERIQMGGAC